MSWRAWRARSKRARWRLRYSTHRVENRSGKFVAEKCKYNRKLKIYVLVKTRTFRARWKAKDQAYKWYCEINKIEFHTYHVVSEKRKQQGKKLYQALQEGKKIKRLKEELPKLGLRTKYRRKVLKKKGESNE